MGGSAQAAVDEKGDPSALDTSIEAYLRGFELKQDYYNGVNYATLLEVRALRSAQEGRSEDAIADRVVARRAREQVLRYLAPTLEDPEALMECDKSRAYWLLASAWEAHAGLGQADAAARLEAQARAVEPDGWMLQTTQEQIERIRSTQESLKAALGRRPLTQRIVAVGSRRPEMERHVVDVWPGRSDHQSCP
jgi:hypothetical protein